MHRFGYELRRANPHALRAYRADPREVAAIEQLIRQFTARQPPSSRLADARKVRSYLSDRRLSFFDEVIQLCRELDIRFQHKTVADVGSGMGYLLRRIQQEEPTARLSGYDTFTDVLPLAESICPTAEFHSVGLQDIDRQFDRVFFTECLEHMVNPALALAQLADLTSPGGTLFITVPNGRTDQHPAFDLRQDGTAYWGHINFWSPESWRCFVAGQLSSSQSVRVGQLASGENYAVIWQ